MKERGALHGRNVELPVVGHCRGCLSKTVARTDAEGGDAAVVVLGTDGEVHPRRWAIEEEHESAAEFAQQAQAVPEGVVAAAQFDHRGRKPHIDTIQETAMKDLAADGGEPHLAHIDPAGATAEEGIDGGFGVCRMEVPIAGKVVDDAVGDDAQRGIVAACRRGADDAVEGIAQGRIATYDKEGAIAVLREHGGKAFHTPLPLTLHKVVGHAPQVEVRQDPPPASQCAPAAFGGAIYDAPAVGVVRRVAVHKVEDCVDRNSSRAAATFSSIGRRASIQWMVQPRRSIPLNHVIWRLANWWMAVSSWATISS